MFRPPPKKDKRIFEPDHSLPDCICVYVSDDGIALGYHANVDLPLGKDIIISDQTGNRFIPTLIGWEYDRNCIWAGNDTAHKELNLSIWGLVRILGRSYAELQDSDDAAHFTLVQTPSGELHVKFAGMSRTPEEFLSLLLRQARHMAWVQMCNTVDDIILLHEAHLDLRQQAALKRAAELAGWKVRRQVRQSVAAAMGFAWAHDPRRSLPPIMDYVPKSQRADTLGNGTRFMVSYTGLGGTELSQVDMMEDEGMEVLWVESDPSCGIHDLDCMFARHLLKYIRPKGTQPHAIDTDLWQHLIRVSANVRESFHCYVTSPEWEILGRVDQTEVYLEDDSPIMISQAEWTQVCAPFFARVETFWRRSMTAHQVTLEENVVVLGLGAVQHVSGLNQGFERVFGVAGARGRALGGFDDGVILRGGIAYAGFHSGTNPDFLLLDTNTRGLYLDVVSNIAGVGQRVRQECVAPDTILPYKTTIELRVPSDHQGPMIVEVFDSLHIDAQPIGCYALDLQQSDAQRTVTCDIDCGVDQSVYIHLSTEDDTVYDSGYLPWPGARAQHLGQLPVLPTDDGLEKAGADLLAPTPPKAVDEQPVKKRCSNDD